VTAALQAQAAQVTVQQDHGPPALDHPVVEEAAPAGEQGGAHVVVVPRLERGRDRHGIHAQDRDHTGDVALQFRGSVAKLTRTACCATTL
jgi:hypothetical protein